MSPSELPFFYLGTLGRFSAMQHNTTTIRLVRLYAACVLQWTAFSCKVLFLSIIDLNPFIEAWIYSTLTYIQSQVEQLDIPNPCITFDQPLWLKSMEIIHAKSMDIVCRHGDFHNMVRYIVPMSIDSLVEGSDQRKHYKLCTEHMQLLIWFQERLFNEHWVKTSW